MVLGRRITDRMEGLGMESRREDETELMLRSTNWVLDCLRCLL